MNWKGVGLKAQNEKAQDKKLICAFLAQFFCKGITWLHPPPPPPQTGFFQRGPFNSLTASDNFCRLLSNLKSLTLIIFQKEFFEKVDFEKTADDKKVYQITHHATCCIDWLTMSLHFLFELFIIYDMHFYVF